MVVRACCIISQWGKGACYYSVSSLSFAFSSHSPLFYPLSPPVAFLWEMAQNDP